MQKLETSCSVGKIINWYGHSSLAIPQKVKQLIYNPAIPLLCTYPRKLKASVCTKTCIQIVTAVLFLKAKKLETIKNVYQWWTSLEVQWLRLLASTAGCTGSMPGQGTTIPHATQYDQKKKNLSPEKWINKLWYINTMELFSYKNQWVKLENIMLHKINLSHMYLYSHI